MTWDPRDIAKQKRRMNSPGTTSTPRVDHAPPPQEHLPPWQRAVPPMRSQGIAPDQIPTLAHEMMWLNSDGDEERDDYTMEEKNLMMAEGLWTPKQWDRWSFMARRGIIDL